MHVSIGLALSLYIHEEKEKEGHLKTDGGHRQVIDWSCIKSLTHVFHNKRTHAQAGIGQIQHRVPQFEYRHMNGTRCHPWKRTSRPGRASSLAWACAAPKR